MDKQITKTRSAVTGVIGFWLGSILGNIFTYLVAISGIVGWIVGFVPQEQILVRLLFAIALAFLTVGLGGAVAGVFNGWVLNRIDTGGDRRHFLVGAGYAYFVGHGILLIPIILVISLLGLYNNGPKIQPQSYVLLFSLFGLIYGLIIGLTLSLLTVNFKRIWGVLLAVVVGYTLGGFLLGLFLWRADLFSSGLIPLRVILRLIFMSLLINLPAGALVGLAYHNLAQKELNLGRDALKPGRLQQGVVIGVSLVILFSVAGFIRDAESFLTVNPAATATQLDSETVGVHWIPATSLPVNSPSNTLSSVDISSSLNGSIGVVWAQEGNQSSDIFYAFMPESPDEDATWSEPINISSSSSIISGNPQLTMDSSGQAHIVWEENDPDSETAQILYSRCQNTNCSSPVLLSVAESLPCATDISGEISSRPSISIDSAGQLMTAWSAGSGQLLYNTWSAGDLPSQEASGCISSTASPDGSNPGSHLAGGAEGVFAIAYSTGGMEQSGDIFVQRFENGEWSSPTSSIGVGSTPDLMLDAEGHTHVAWCGENRIVNYQLDEGSTESISSPGCPGPVELGLDSEGNPHLVWYSNEVENVNGLSSSGDYVYESIRTEDGWSDAALITQTGSTIQPAVASLPGGTLHLAWSDDRDSMAIHYAYQDPYQCDVNMLTDLGKVALTTMQNGGFHPPGYEVPFCHNQFIDFIYQPNPEPAFSSDPPQPNGGFDQVAALADTVEYEVLFVNMEWDEDENNLSPGSSFARGVADLYQRIKADPSQFPRGLLVRILLGNYPEITTLEWGTQIWNVMSDLRDAGVEELENPEIGWKVEVADYAGTYPHSHTKFVVVDGKLLLGAGFNYGWLHLPKDHPSGKGDDLVDLGIVVLGPVAQAAISAYDDMWAGANKLYCDDLFPTDGTS